MNIRWKVTALVAILFALLSATEMLVARNVLMPSFSALERTEADVAMRRIQYAVDVTLDQLVLSATGWGNWTDTFRFAKDHNRAFIDENMTVIGLKQLNVNALMVVDLSGRYLTAGTIDLKTGEPIDVDLARARELSAGSPLRANLADGRSARGFLQTNRGTLMVASAPILDGYGHGPSRGMVIMGRLLSPAEVARIGAEAQARLFLRPRASLPAGDRSATTDDVVQVYRSFSDLFGRPIFTLQVDVPREITHRGYSAVRYASAYLMGAAVLVLALLVIVINRVVLNPLARVTRHAVAIGEGRDLTTRLDFKGEDEIGVLAREFDRMVARVGESRSQLVDQSFHAGFAELAKGVLHNLGNAMTPVGVRLAGLGARLRAAPIDDARQAVAELTRGEADPVRRADLQEFVHLACDRLAATLASVEEDVQVIARQTAIVQSVLSEQMRSTRNEHVIEFVRLPELLAQSLDVVPDSARQQLEVAAEDSLHGVGVVAVPRTILRLVLQNFIINAADAVRDSGKPKGSIRVAAHIESAEDSNRLYLHCTDDGVGISAENLDRIFEKGFSTKSQETNFGLGLHWCANVVGALGGRVWATSEGAGHGASLHVMVPLASHRSQSIVQAA